MQINERASDYEAGRIEVWLVHCEARLRESTWTTYGYIVGQLLDWTRKNRSGNTIFDLTEADLNAFLLRPRGQGRRKPAHNTLRNTEICLTSFYKFMAKRYGTANPVEHWKPRRASVDPRPYDLTQVDAAIRMERNPVWRLALLLGVDAGMRRMEIRTLTWDSVKFDGDEEGWLFIRNSKYGKDRQIPFAGRLGRALDACPTRPYHRNVIAHMSAGHQGAPFHQDVILKGTKRALQRAGIINPNMHRLRHTFATAAMRDGTPVPVVSKLLGHASIATTVSIYTGVSNDDLMAAVRRRNGLLDAS